MVGERIIYEVVGLGKIKACNV